MGAVGGDCRDESPAGRPLRPPAIYEAALEHEGVFVRVDVLARNGYGWDLIEVKASTRPEKGGFLSAMPAIQYWVATGAGLKIYQAGILVLDTNYVYEGGPYDLEQLFRLGDATEFCQEGLEATEAAVAEFHQMLAADKPPAIQIGNHCFTPYDCPYYGACTAGMGIPRPSDQRPLPAERRSP